VHARSQLHSLTSENGSPRQRLSLASAALSELPAARAEAAAARAQAEQLAAHNDALTAHAEQLLRHLAAAARQAGAQQPRSADAAHLVEEAMCAAEASNAGGREYAQASPSGFEYLDRPVFAGAGYGVGLSASLD